MCKVTLCIITSICLFQVSCTSASYEKAIRKNLGIEHVFSRPTTAYGPGAVVMFEKKSGYTGVCLPAWTIGNQLPIISPIADIAVSKSSTIGLKVDLNAKEKAKVGVNYEDISEIIMTFVNGCQYEIMTDLEAAFNKMGQGTCGGNCRVLLKEHPESRLYFIRVVYAYDLDVKIKRKNGVTLNGEIPKEVLDVVSAKIGINIESKVDQGISGKGLYIGFNGTPRNLSTQSVVKGNVSLRNVQDPIVDITDLLK